MEIEITSAQKKCFICGLEEELFLLKTIAISTIDWSSGAGEIELEDRINDVCENCIEKIKINFHEFILKNKLDKQNGNETRTNK
jgi:hypothetical protein